MNGISKEGIAELNRCMAEKVMGWKLTDAETGRVCSLAADFDNALNNDGYTWDGEHEAWQWKPCTNRADAFQILEKCFQKTNWCSVSIWLAKEYNIVLNKPEIKVKAPTLPFAICLFAQKLFTP